MIMFTFQSTLKPPCNVRQIQMTGSRQGTLNLQSERITCKFAISNIQGVHTLSKSVFPFYGHVFLFILSVPLSVSLETLLH